jgi:phosphopantothenate-cysteine ligase
MFENAIIDNDKVSYSSDKLSKAVTEYKTFSKNMFKINFDTVSEYLTKLEEISKAIKLAGNKSVTYLAAAVSDFYVPDSELIEHKIQSREVETLNLNLK